MIYIGTFFVSIILFVVSEHIKNNRLRIVFALLAISVASFLAGARDWGIGRDTNAYVLAAFNWAQKYNFSDYIIRFSDSPLLYTVWYFIIKTTKSSFLLFFSAEFIIEFFIYKGLIYCKNDKKFIWLGMIVYYLIFYTYSLSLIRQSIAMSILFYGYTKFLKNFNYKKYIIICCLAIAIHPTATVCLFLLVVHKIIYSGKGWTSFKKILLYLLTLIGIFIIILFANRIIGYLITINANYSYYESNMSTFKDTFVSWIMFFILSILAYLTSRLLKPNNNKNFELYTIFGGLAVFWTNIIANNSYRVSFYFLIVILDLFCSSYQQEKNSITTKRNRIVITPLIIITCFIIWYIMVVTWGINDIYPYKSVIFDI